MNEKTEETTDSVEQETEKLLGAGTEGTKWIYDKELKYYVQADPELYELIKASNAEFDLKQETERSHRTGYFDKFDRSSRSWWGEYEQESESWYESPSRFWSSRTSYYGSWGSYDVGSYQRIEKLRMAARTIHTLTAKYPAPPGGPGCHQAYLIDKEEYDLQIQRAGKFTVSPNANYIFMNIPPEGKSNSDDIIIGQALAGLSVYKSNKQELIDDFAKNKGFEKAVAKRRTKVEKMVKVAKGEDPDPSFFPIKHRSLATGIRPGSIGGQEPEQKIADYSKIIAKSELDRRGLEYCIEDSPGFEPYLGIFHKDSAENLVRDVTALHSQCETSVRFCENFKYDPAKGFWPVAVMILAGANRVFYDEKLAETIGALAEYAKIELNDIRKAGLELNSLKPEPGIQDYADASIPILTELMEKYPLPIKDAPPAPNDAMSSMDLELQGEDVEVSEGGEEADEDDEGAVPANAVACDATAEVNHSQHHCFLIDRNIHNLTKTYSDIKNEAVVHSLSKRISDRIHELYREDSHKLRSLRSGDIDDGSLDRILIDPDPAVFERREIKGRIGISVGFLLDASGSMASSINWSDSVAGGYIPEIDRRKVHYLFGGSSSSSHGRGSISLSDACIRIGVGLVEGLKPFKNKGLEIFTGYHTADTRLAGASTYASRLNGVPADETPWQVVVGLCSGFTEHDEGIVLATNQANNADGYALDMFWKQMRKKARKSKRILFVLSDGQPAASVYSGGWGGGSGSYGDGVNHVKEVVETIRRKGDLVISIGVGEAKHSMDVYHEMYGASNCIFANSSAELTSHFVGQVYRLMKRHIDRSENR